ncbi:radical SAM family heme chaperone HemW [Pectinatus haikarae]|uniref:radical SAM family heme chaperone HemW n=1 Tax=Pectinatus haikarae TaxID=349096 RepID=UPI001E5FDC39|nr:radical SAM family heme chaperone HemW [Pectinatus haikarae]
MISVYIHIPFCLAKCLYCDFPSTAAEKNIYHKYISALRQEIKLKHQQLGSLFVDTVYFGGGTPSLLPAEYITEILTALNSLFYICADAEITLEANPGTVNLPKLAALKQSGVNRLSFGVQSTQNILLKNLGRIHTFEDAKKAVNAAKKADFSNISLDLMYGLPHQTLVMLQESTNWILHQNIQHVSIYGLQVEDGTPFAEMQKAGTLHLPDEDAVETMYDYVTDILPHYGFHRYEIANFAKKGFESRHNTGYWQDKPYIGLGCAAHSYYNSKRTYNTHDLYEYIRSCNNGIIPVFTEEIIDSKAWMEEFCFLALRTAQGINKNSFQENFHRDIHTVYGKNITELLSQKLLAENTTHLFLTPLGMKLGNAVFEKFLL